MAIINSINLSSLDGSNGFRLDGVAAGDRSGRVVGSVGDVNGDGFDDVIIGALRADPNGSYSGSSYVVFGKASGFAATLALSSLDGSNGFRVDGKSTYDYSNISIGNAGDVNGDGLEDMIARVFGSEQNGSRSASTSYVVFGKASGFAATLDLSSLDGSDGFRVDGESTYDHSHVLIDNAGDVNGDGLGDMIVRVFGFDVNGNRSESSYVVFGKISGFAATLDLSSLDGSNGFLLNEAVVDDQSNYSISNAGDVNGDGFADVIFGAPDADPNGESSGSTYVVFGKASGFDATLELSSLDGSNGFRLDGVAAGDRSGSVVSSAGDINGDGFDDVIVHAPGANKYGYYNIPQGTRYVVFGRASGFDATLDLSSLDGSNGFRLDGASTSRSSASSAGDINGDGFADVLVETTVVGRYTNHQTGYVVFGKASGFSAEMNIYDLDGNNGFHLIAGEPSQSFQNPSMMFSSAGDINDDGFDDLIVGVVAPSVEANDPGVSYVVFGKASGFNATLDLFSPDNSIGLRLDGEELGDYSGGSVSNAGDLNGDGFDDVIIGAFGADPNGDNSGSSYVIFGRSDFGSGIPEIVGTPKDDQLKGTAAAEHFKAGGGNDSMIGRGGADIFKAGAGNDKITVTDLDFASVDGGTGNDVLHLAGNGLNLDLADFGGDISGIETFCLFGKGDNTLTLTAADLLNLSDTTNTLKVNGNAAGHLIVEDSGWIDGGPRGSGYYHVYTNDDAVLLVGMNVTVDFA